MELIFEYVPINVDSVVGSIRLNGVDITEINIMVTTEKESFVLICFILSIFFGAKGYTQFIRDVSSCIVCLYIA